MIHIKKNDIHRIPAIAAPQDTKCPELVRDADLHTDDSLPPQPGMATDSYWILQDL